MEKNKKTLILLKAKLEIFSGDRERIKHSDDTTHLSATNQIKNCSTLLSVILIFIFTGSFLKIKLLIAPIRTDVKRRFSKKFGVII